MSIAAVYGRQRRGKSLFALFYGVYLSEKYQKRLVTNFPLNPIKLAHYCRMMGYHWLSKHLSDGALVYLRIRETSDLIRLFRYPNTIIVADELAVYLPARGSSYNTSVELRESFVQVGHAYQHLIFIAQNPEQVDFALRSQVEEIFYADGMLSYSKALNNDALRMKNVKRFEPDSWEVFSKDPKIRRNPIKSKLISTKNWFGLLSCSDTFQFQIYESFTKLNEQEVSDQSDSLRYIKKKDWLWVSSGTNPHNYSHFLSWLITLFFNWMPGSFLDDLMRIDSMLSKFKSLNPLERKILKFGVPTFLFLVITSIL